jgi:hypothetical protein
MVGICNGGDELQDSITSDFLIRLLKEDPLLWLTSLGNDTIVTVSMEFDTSTIFSFFEGVVADIREKCEFYGAVCQLCVGLYKVYN